MAVLLVINNPGKAAAMTRWGIRFATARDEVLEILFTRHSRKSESIQKLGPDERLEGEDGIDEIQQVLAECSTCNKEPLPTGMGEAPLGSKEGFTIRLRFLKHHDRYHAIMNEVKAIKPSLLILGKHESARTRNPDAMLARRLFDHTHCTTVLLRPGDADGRQCKTILIPTSGGDHSAKAMREAVKIAKLEAGEITPLFVEPDADDYSKEIGQRILEKLMKLARVEDTDTVHPRVILNSNVKEAIQSVAEEGFDLLLLGQTHAGNLRRRIFGAVPEKLLAGAGNMTIAILKKASPVGHQMREAMEQWLSLRIPQLEREDRIALCENLQVNSRWSFDFMALICLSTAIASLGLILNSGAVVIGAMLVAPLMTPLLGSGLALVQGNQVMMRAAIKAVILGFFFALTIGVLIGLIAPIDELTSEMRSRGGPNLLDMGVAFLSGVAASYCVARPKLSSALAGVAIAAALVPPIATTGFSIALGETGNAQGAALLFGTNVVAIILGSSINFWIAGIRGRSTNSSGGIWALRTWMTLVVVLASLCIPLGSFLVSNIKPLATDNSASSYTRMIRRVLTDHPGIYLQEYKVTNRAGKRILEITITSSEVAPKELANTLAREIEDGLGTPMEVHLRTLLETRSGSKPDL